MQKTLMAFIRRLASAAKVSPATTTVAAVPLLIGALIQILYGFDADPDTHTDWNLVITSGFGALGFTLAQDNPKPDPPVPTPTPPPTPDRKRPRK